ncbi:MAG: DUF4388 domain-containing protein [Thermodesulfobacteriota bacterium]
MSPKKNKASKPLNDLLTLYLNTYRADTRFAEAYRTLRTNIYFSFMEKKFQSLLVTSAGEGEGKTSTVANLAYTIAQTGKSVLMIDADMRKPLLSKLVNFNESIGLTGLLTDVFDADIQGGSLKNFGIHDLFKLLTLKKRTGLLHLTDGPEKIDLFFLKGEIVDINWLTRPAEKKLAKVLIDHKLLTSEQAQEGLIRQKDTGQRLGFILVSMGFVKEDDLIGFLTIHMIEALQTALHFQSGEFSFKDFSESDFERAAFDPVDYKKIYKQVVVGEEKFPYLQEKINAAILPTETNNLFLLPVNYLPPNPSELLGSERMDFLISILKKRFDILIIDTPPILPTSDALLLSSHVDGVVVVVRSGYMNRKMVKKALGQIHMAKANLLGVVLSQVDLKRESYYKYYHKYYASYYGEKK